MDAISKENRKWIAEQLDKLIKLNGVLEAFDSTVIGLVLSVLNDKVLDKLKDEIKQRINLAVDYVRAEQYDEACEVISTLLSDYIKTPVIDGSDSEDELYDVTIKAVFMLIWNWVNSKTPTNNKIPFTFSITNSGKLQVT